MYYNCITSPTSEQIRNLLANQRDLQFDEVMYASEFVPQINLEGTMTFEYGKPEQGHYSLIPMASAVGQYLQRIGVPGQFFGSCTAHLKQQILSEFHTNRRFILRCYRTPSELGEVKNCRAVLGPRYPTTLDNINAYPLVLDLLETDTSAQLHLFRQDIHITELLSMFGDTQVNHDGHNIQAGLSITNSETGHSSFWIEPCIKVNGQFISSRASERIVHRGTLPLADSLSTKIAEMKTAAQVGIIQYLELGQEVIGKQEACDYVSNIVAMPKRLVNIIQNEWKDLERINKLNFMHRILQAASELPLILNLQVRRDIGDYSGIFTNTNNRMSRLAEQMQ